MMLTIPIPSSIHIGFPNERVKREEYCNKRAKYERCHEKASFLNMRKTKTQINSADM